MFLDHERLTEKFEALNQFSQALIQAVVIEVNGFSIRRSMGRNQFTRNLGSDKSRRH